MNVTEIDLAALDGTPDVLSNARGKTALFVNVASKCGLTPQYAGLQALQQELGGDEFTVLGFPCNQFGGQEPGSPEEIATFCSTTYGVDFPLSEKLDVNGEDRHPLYEQLIAVPDAEGHTGDIRWNFEKFVVGPDGNVVARFGPLVEPGDPAIGEAIDTATAT
jgi:glutathione peroxidase